MTTIQANVKCKNQFPKLVEEELKPIWWEDKGGTAPLSLSDQILQLTNRETSGKEDRIKYLR